MSGSVEDLFITLDRVDAPDQWSDIVTRGDGNPSHASGRRPELVLEAAPRAAADGNPRKRGDMDRRGWMSALGVAAAAVVLVAVVVAVNRGDDGSDGSSPATNPPATAETLPKPFDEQAALSANAAYFDAYNAGDLETLMAMFVADATFAGGIGPMVRPEFEELIAWNLAQGTVLTTPECEVTALEVGAVFSVVCSYGNLDSIVQAVDGPPVMMSLKVAVTPEGITSWNRSLRPADFGVIADPFERWMTETHPLVADQVGFVRWASSEDAAQGGVLTARYAQEWAAYLEANGCLDGDEPLAVKLAC